MPSATDFFSEVCRRFGLGQTTLPPVVVPGGLSNRLYHLRTDQGEFAVKRMVANADSPAFQRNVEAAFVVEQRAAAAGISMPIPIPVPGSGYALARMADQNGPCWVRVHRWIAGEGVEADNLAPGDLDDLATILARLHDLPCDDIVSDAALEAPSVARDWTTALARHADIAGSLHESVASLEHIVRLGYESGSRADVLSHRDLDAKNLLRGPDGFIVLDWDAAGPTNAHWDTVVMALDWAGVRADAISTDAFERFLAAYTEAGGTLGPIREASFAGWAEGVLDWLWFNLDRASSADPLEQNLGRHEVAASARFMPSAAEWILAR